MPSVRSSIPLREERPFPPGPIRRFYWRRRLTAQRHSGFSRRALRAAAAALLLAVGAAPSPAPAAPAGYAAQAYSPAAPGSEQAGRRTRTDFLDTLFWAPEIVVEARRIAPDDAVFDRSGFVQLIDLRSRRDRAEDAAALLSRATGVRVRRWGGLGSPAAVSIRGSSSTQVQFYVDGVPLCDAWSGTADLSDVATGDFDRIEIFRGTSPTGFGSSSIGGTINLVSSPARRGPAGAETPQLEARAAAGSFDARRLYLALRGASGPLSARLGAGYERSAGDFAFLDDNGTPLNPGDDEQALRLNNDYERLSLSGRLALAAPRFDDISLAFSDVRREGGVPGIGSNQSSGARSERLRRLGYLKLRPSPLGGRRVHLEGTGFYSWIADRLEDRAGEIGLARRATDNRILSHGGSLRAKIFWPAASATLETFCEGRKERFRPADLFPVRSEGPDRLRRTLTTAAAGEIGLPGRLFLTAGMRSEWSRSEYYDEPPFPWLPATPAGRIEDREYSPSLGLRAQPADWVTLKGNWGRYYRLPTFFELFGNLGTVTGAPGLTPERGTNRDIGVILAAERLWRIERPFLEAVYLSNEAHDLILFFQNSQYTVKPTNIGSARIEGFELSFSGTTAGFLRLSGNWCRLVARDTGPIPYYYGNRLPGRPVHETAWSAELFGGRWSAGWEVHYIGGNYLDRANLREAPGRTVHNATITLRSPRRGLTLTLEGQNLTDRRAYDVIGYPLPGRSFYATLGLSN